MVVNQLKVKSLLNLVAVLKAKEKLLLKVVTDQARPREILEMV